MPATIGPGAPDGLGRGIFLADKDGQLSSVGRPGPSPGHSPVAVRFVIGAVELPRM